MAAIEDVLDLYAQPYDPAAPRVCFDEKPLVIHGEVREPLPVKPGHPQRSDYEYERLGTANLFVFVEPLAGRRAVELTEQRTKLMEIAGKCPVHKTLKSEIDIRLRAAQG